MNNEWLKKNIWKILGGALVLYFVYVFYYGKGGYVDHESGKYVDSQPAQQATQLLYVGPKTNQIPVANELIVLTNKKTLLDFRDGNTRYTFLFTMIDPHDKCWVWDPEGHMEHPIHLGAGEYLNLDKGNGVNIRMLEFWTDSGQTVPAQYEFVALR